MLKCHRRRWIASVPTTDGTSYSRKAKIHFPRIDAYYELGETFIDTANTDSYRRVDCDTRILGSNVFAMEHDANHGAYSREIELLQNNFSVPSTKSVHIRVAW
jgi:hypothetical protein